MARLGWHHLVQEEVDRLDSALRARCKAHLDRLRDIQPGAPHGLRLEKVHAHLTELKVSWNKQEFRFLFFSQGQNIYLVNFFQKKTRKTPPAEITLALARMREIQLGTANIVSQLIH